MIVRQPSHPGPMTTTGAAARRTVLAPQPGSQVLFLSCPIFECLYEGTRGPGKTWALILDFLQFVGRGYGRAWRGVLFRRTYPELSDVVSKSKEIITLCFPDADFNEAKYTWTFKTGEQLLFRHMRKPDDYWAYHGHEYPWIGWEELTTWPDDRCFKRMMSCCRSSHPGMPFHYRATTNPYGRGHNWVKRRYQLPQMRGRIIKTEGENDRVAIHGRLEENQKLLAAVPNYRQTLVTAAVNPAQLEAWLDGSWDVTSGGMFDDLWDHRKHVVQPFRVPRTWSIHRSFDWGESKPFSVGWWAKSDGSPYTDARGREVRTVRGDWFRIGEWYGCVRGEENVGLRMLAADIAVGIKMREVSMGIAGRVKNAIADASIFDENNGNCVERDMRAKGVSWRAADKSGGSRKHGWGLIRRLLRDAANLDEELKPRNGPRMSPGLFVFATCAHWIRTVPPISRDETDPDDVDTEAEDHAADETRYILRERVNETRGGSM